MPQRADPAGSKITEQTPHAESFSARALGGRDAGPTDSTQFLARTCYPSGHPVSTPTAQAARKTGASPQAADAAG